MRGEPHTCTDGVEALTECVALLADPAEQDAQCDGLDNDCDGVVDDGYVVVVTQCGDGVCAASVETSCVGGNQVLPVCVPGAPIGGDDDSDCDDVDENCSGAADENFVATFACAGQGACGAQVAVQCVAGQQSHECPVAETEVCDGIDNDCDGVVDNVPQGAMPVYHPDVDEDGFGDTDTSEATCSPQAGWIQNGTDCDDSDAAVSPAATEVCDSIDNNCNTFTDDADPELDPASAQLWYVDLDGDMFGGDSVLACQAPGPGHVQIGNDCDDSNAAINPNATELCDQVDNDCDGTVDVGSIDGVNWYEDADSDGYGNPAESVVACVQPGGYVPQAADCNDSDAAVFPAALEICDGIDNNCDSVTDIDAIDRVPWYVDNDIDGFGVGMAMQVACGPVPPGIATVSGDCDDTTPFISPDANEKCDGVDNDCDGGVDNNAVDAFTLYVDFDGDGYGNAGLPTIVGCGAVGYSPVAGDCNDLKSAISPDAQEICDGADNNCNGATDEGCPNVLDSDNDGLTDAQEAALGSNPRNSDDDNDGVPTSYESKADGAASNAFFASAIGDSTLRALDDVETSSLPDTDSDGTLDFLDTDDDGDGLLTRVEVSALVNFESDTDNDGTPDFRDDDDDGDSVPTLVELQRSGDPKTDSDGDGTPDYRDDDDDGDGIPTATEVGVSGGAAADTDDDGIPDYLDTDADGDGTPDQEEGTGDEDGDGVPDYIDDDDAASASAASAPLSSRGCSASSARRTSSAPWGLTLFALAFGGVVLGRRRARGERRTSRQVERNAHR